jgi:uncharacterized membrane protein
MIYVLLLGLVSVLVRKMNALLDRSPADSARVRTEKDRRCITIFDVLLVALTVKIVMIQQSYHHIST